MADIATKQLIENVGNIVRYWASDTVTLEKNELGVAKVKEAVMAMAIKATGLCPHSKEAMLFLVTDEIFL